MARVQPPSRRASPEESTTPGNAPRSASIRRNVDGDKPIQNFDDYANLFWAAHCELCGERRRKDAPLQGYLHKLLLESDLEDPRAKFNRWIAEVQNLVSQVPPGFYDEQIEEELGRCISPLPTHFQVCCVYGFTEIVKTVRPEPPSGTSGSVIGTTPDATQGVPSTRLMRVALLACTWQASLTGPRR